jgi:hypothetical protein
MSVRPLANLTVCYPIDPDRAVPFQFPIINQEGNYVPDRFTMLSIWEQLCEQSAELSVNQMAVLISRAYYEMPGRRADRIPSSEWERMGSPKHTMEQFQSLQNAVRAAIANRQLHGMEHSEHRQGSFGKSSA